MVNIEKVWSEYQTSLKAFLHKNISNPDDVDDLLQEILIKTHKNLTTVRDSKKVKSWLFQVANNTIVDFYRQNKKGRELSEGELWYSETEDVVLQQLSGCIIPFINRLPNEDIALLTAIEIEGMSQKAYAKKQGVNYSTIKSRVQKSRKKLYGFFNECCDFAIDSQGNMMNFQAKNKNCTIC